MLPIVKEFKLLLENIIRDIEEKMYGVSLLPNNTKVGGFYFLFKKINK